MESDRKVFQQKMRKAIIDNVDSFSLHGHLQRRFRRWRREWMFWPPVERLATRACGVIERHLNRMPPCVISA
eukprot:6118073-Karenia_brevis.AAC.1